MNLTSLDSLAYLPVNGFMYTILQAHKIGRNMN